VRQYQLSDLRLRCQQRADKEGDPQIDTNEWNRLISEMNGELYSVVEAAGMRYFESEQTITATGAASYAVPSDHFATIDVEWVYDAAGHRRRLRRLNVQERARWSGATGDAHYWELAGQSLFLYPAPSSGTYKHLYMPQAPDLSLAADNTNVDLVAPDGEAFLIYGVMVKALAKSEGDVQLAMAERDAARERFVYYCAIRSFNDAPRPNDGGAMGYGGGGDSWNPASFRWNPP
jgi:hypothetical protein